MMHVGDIMSTVGVFSTVGEKIFCYLSTTTVLMISSHMYHDIPHGTQITKDGIPHGTEYPSRYSQPFGIMYVNETRYIFYVIFYCHP